MLTPEQIDALRDVADQISEPVNRYIIKDIVQRIKDAGKVTATAEYKAAIAKMLKLSKSDLEKFLSEEVPRESAEYQNLFDTVSSLVWKQTFHNSGASGLQNFENNAFLQQLSRSMSALAEDGLKNITQTLGLVDVYGNARNLQDAYINCTDYAFKKVASGAQSYQEAFMTATANIAKYGVRVIDYESGVHSSLDVAMRRNIFGGMGLLVENIEQTAHDEAGFNGWEISAHEASAKDHEPYQGRQYSDEEFAKLNGSAEHPGLLLRRIGTLNCKHMAFPIILGVSEPQYSEEELAAMRNRNAEGITYDGKHYTMYEATQMQRALERRIREQRRRLAIYEKDPDFKDEYTKASVKYNVLQNRYAEFSKAAGLKTQPQRIEVLEFGPKQESNAGKILSITSRPIPSTTKLQIVGDLDLNKIKAVIPDARTSETVLTYERLNHILDNHEDDYDKYLKDMGSVVTSPAYLLEDNKSPYTVIALAQSQTDGKWLKAVIRIATDVQPAEYKNSIITFFHIEDRKMRSLIKKLKNL